MSTHTHDAGSAVRSEGAYRPDAGTRRTFTETKLGLKTSEFLVMVGAIAAILIATYADGDDTLTQNDGWRYAMFVAIAYIVSRGLAKLGTREPYTDER